MLLDSSDEAQYLSGGQRLYSKLFHWMNLLVCVTVWMCRGTQNINDIRSWLILLASREI